MMESYSHLPSVPCPQTPSACSADIRFFCFVLFSLPFACKKSACRVLC